MIHYLPQHLTAPLLKCADKLEDIRLVADHPLIVNMGGEQHFVGEAGESTSADRALCVTVRDVRETLDKMVQSSVYAVQDRLAQGYFTLPGGNRVGVVGSVVIESNRVVRMKEVSALSIRFAREVKGCAIPYMPSIAPGGQVRNTLIISPPGCGKTTLLRDISRMIAGEVYRKAVGVVDERGEISAPFPGGYGCDIGICAVALAYAPKGEGILMLLRSMRPEVIVCDEIGGAEEERAIYHMINAGVKVICSVHGFGEEDILRRRHVASLIKEGIFECVITLSQRMGPMTVESIRC